MLAATALNLDIALLARSVAVFLPELHSALAAINKKTGAIKSHDLHEFKVVLDSAGLGNELDLGASPVQLHLGSDAIYTLLQTPGSAGTHLHISYEDIRSLQPAARAHCFKMEVAPNDDLRARTRPV